MKTRSSLPLRLLATILLPAAASADVSQEVYIKDTPAQIDGRYGAAVELEGDTLVVGAPSDGGGNAGTVHVFVRSGGAWVEQVVLAPPATPAGYGFGTSLDLDGDTLVVGMPWRDGVGTSASGAAFVYVRNAGIWTQQAELTASNADTNDEFGFAVALQGDLLAVGACREDSHATGVDSFQVSNISSNSGAVYTFVRSGGSWTQESYIKASNTEPNDLFGWSLAMQGDTLLVGAIGEDGASSGIDGEQFGMLEESSGAVYAFTRASGAWVQEAYIKATNTDAFDRFGGSLAFDGDTAVVGASGEASSATGVGGNAFNNTMGDAGAAYVLRRAADGTWSHEAYLKASNPGISDQFGASVGLDGDHLVVGAHHESSSSTGVDGDESNDDASWSGAIYTFERSGTSWTGTHYVKGANADADDLFGGALAVSNGTAVVGAPEEDGLNNGVGADSTQSGSWVDAGAVYVLDLLTPPPHATYCHGDGSITICPCGNTGATGEGCANSTGAGALLVPGGDESVAANSLSFHADQLPANQPALLFVGDAMVGGGQGTLFGDGLRCAGGAVVRLGVSPASALGHALWGPGLGTQGGWAGGDLRMFQVWYRDPAGSPCGSAFNLSHGVVISFAP